MTRQNAPKSPERVLTPETLQPKDEAVSDAAEDPLAKQARDLYARIDLTVQEVKSYFDELGGNIDKLEQGGQLSPEQEAKQEQAVRILKTEFYKELVSLLRSVSEKSNFHNLQSRYLDEFPNLEGTFQRLSDLAKVDYQYAPQEQAMLNELIAKSADEKLTEPVKYFRDFALLFKEVFALQKENDELMKRVRASQNRALIQEVKRLDSECVNIMTSLNSGEVGRLTAELQQLLDEQLGKDDLQPLGGFGEIQKRIAADTGKLGLEARPVAAFSAEYDQRDKFKWIEEKPKGMFLFGDVARDRVEKDLKDDKKGPKGMYEYQMAGLDERPLFKTWDALMDGVGFDGADKILVRQVLSDHLVINYYERFAKGSQKEKSDQTTAFMQEHVFPKANRIMTMLYHLKTVFGVTPRQAWAVLGQTKGRQYLKDNRLKPDEFAKYILQNSAERVVLDMEALYRHFEARNSSIQEQAGDTRDVAADQKISSSQEKARKILNLNDAKTFLEFKLDAKKEVGLSLREAVSKRFGLEDKDINKDVLTALVEEMKNMPENKGVFEKLKAAAQIEIYGNGRINLLKLKEVREDGGGVMGGFSKALKGIVKLLAYVVKSLKGEEVDWDKFKEEFDVDDEDETEKPEPPADPKEKLDYEGLEKFVLEAAKESGLNSNVKKLLETFGLTESSARQKTELVGKPVERVEVERLMKGVKENKRLSAWADFVYGLGAEAKISFSVHDLYLLERVSVDDISRAGFLAEKYEAYKKTAPAGEVFSMDKFLKTLVE